MELEIIVGKSLVKVPWWKRALATSALIATTVIATACGPADFGKSNECTYDSDCPSSILQCDNGLCYYTENSGKLNGKLYCEFDNECFNGDNCNNNVCGGSDNIPPVQGSAVLSPNTRILTEQDIDDLLVVSEGTLTFTGSSDYALGLKSGDIIVTGVYDQTPEGLLRTVLEIQNKGSQIEVGTNNSSLEEALQSASFTIPIQFSNKNATIYAPLMDMETGQFPLTVYTLNVNFDNTNIYQNNITLDGSLKANLDSNLSVEIKGNKIKSLRYTISGEEVLDLTVSGEISKALHKELPPLELGPFSPFVVVIPAGPIPFPVVLTPNASITAGVECAGTVSAQTSVLQSLSLEFGLEYINGLWEKIAGFENNFDFSPPELGLTQGELTVYAIPSLGLDLYGIAGPFGDVKGYVRGEAGYSQGMWWKLFAGLEVIAGVKVEIFGKSLANFSDVVYQLEELLASYNAECNSHTTTTCHNGDVYWQNSCGDLEEIADNCTSTETCINAKCKPKGQTCQDECDLVGELSCILYMAMECEEGNDGCLDKVVVEYCGYGEYCSDGECKPNEQTCQDECNNEGEKWCEGDNVFACKEGDEGCLEIIIANYCGAIGEKCVDGKCSGQEPLYVDLGNGTVLDNESGTVWQKTSYKAIYGSNVNEVDAEVYCQDSNTAGHTWRLPTLGELSELCLPNNSEFTTGSTFNLSNNKFFWSSTEKEGSYYHFYLGELNFTCTFSTCYKQDECGDVLCIKD